MFHLALYLVLVGTEAVNDRLRIEDITQAAQAAFV